MGYIFISYSHKDKKYVEILKHRLIDEGFSVWIDHNIDYGDEWLKVIQKYLDGCNVFIVVMSKNSFESDMVQNEVTRAREKKKNIFPILLGGENWLIFQAKQYIDARDGSLPPEKFYKRLEKVISRKKIEKVVQPAPSTKLKPTQKLEQTEFGNTQLEHKTNLDFQQKQPDNKKAEHEKEKSTSAPKHILTDDNTLAIDEAFSTENLDLRPIEEPKKKNYKLTIIIITALLIICCLCALGWQFGDQLMYELGLY